jgi:hypothetical protein
VCRQCVVLACAACSADVTHACVRVLQHEGVLRLYVLRTQRS